MIFSANSLARLIGFIIAALFTTPVAAESLKCPCKVVQVLDGDTVFVLDQHRSSRKIWLAGIDAPPLNQRFGPEARQHLTGLVIDQRVEVEYQHRDRYGRIFGKLLKDGQDMNLQLIKDGFAMHYKQGEQEQSQKDRASYDRAEAEAKRQRLGLWSLIFAGPDILQN